MERVPGSFLQIQSSKFKNEIIHIKNNFNRKNYVIFSFFLFKLYYYIHVLLVVYHFGTGQLNLSGPLLAYLMVEYTIIICGLLIHKTVPCMSGELVAAFNKVYTEPPIQSSPVLIMFMRWIRWTYGSAIVLFVILFVWLPYNPWINLIQDNFQIKTQTFSVAIKIWTSAYEVWTFASFGGYAIFICYYGMYCGHAGIQILTQKFQTQKFNGYRTITNYRKLLIRVELVNTCYQRIVAITVKLILMPVSVVFGAVLIKLRNSTSFDVVFILGYLLISCYFAMSFGYYFPGRANSISKRIIPQWKSDLVLSFQRERNEFKVTQKVLNSLQQVKIRFGSVSFYERGTSIVIVNFLLEKTISLALLM